MQSLHGPSHQEGGQILSQAGGKTHNMQLGPKSEVALIGWQIMLFIYYLHWQSRSLLFPVADDAM